MKIDEVKENQTLLRMYRTLLRKAKPRFKSIEDGKRLRHAFKFAVHAHRDMRRRSGEPYIYHPIAVAMIVVDEIGLGTTSVLAALLHDVVEDTEYTLRDIEEQFGEKVAIIIDGLTKISVNSNKNASMQAENFRKMLLTISKDIRVVLIKIADRLHNMRTLKSMPKDKQLKIKSETEFIYAPLAHRLGLYTVKSELEDLALRYSDHEAYSMICKKLDATKEARRRFTRNFVLPIESSLRAQGFPFQIKARTKSIRSIYNKMHKQNIPFEEVYDLFAIRIIFDSSREAEKANCWKIYSIVTDYYTPNVNRLRDWISVPKSNGYESLHTTVMGPKGSWVEVQIRSRRMDEIAEMGYAAHWKYKENVSRSREIENNIESWLTKVREMLENNDMNAIEFLDEFRSNLFNKEVFAFTPKGDLRHFARGATVLDFAFDIHTEVGAKALGAKINGVLVPLNHQLQNGDQVEILTSNKVKANEGWLKYATTSKAKSKIKEYLKEDQKRIAGMGREIVERKLKHIKVPFTDAAIHQLTDFFNLKSEAELFYQIGKGIIDHTEIKRFRDAKVRQEESKKMQPEDAKDFKKKMREIRKGDDELVIGENMSHVDYGIASCCNPIPGDDIFGFITINNGIKIHRTNCPNAVSLMANFGYRIIRARWANQKDREFEMTILIEGGDRVGLVNDITKVISNQHKINIKSIAIDTVDTIFKGKISLFVQDKEEVEDMIAKMEKVEGVLKITRYENVEA